MTKIQNVYPKDTCELVNELFDHYIQLNHVDYKSVANKERETFPFFCCFLSCPNHCKYISLDFLNFKLL